MIYTREQAIAAFWVKVEVRAADECWPWKAAHFPNGYGMVHWEGRPTGAHRIAFFLSNGYLPEGKYVCHTCDNRPCCNPIHLFAGNPLENVADCDRKGRRAKGPKHGNAKLTRLQVIELRRLHDQGISYDKLAKMFGITRSVAHKIGVGIHYKEVN